MNLVEAMEKTSSVALNYTSATDHSVLLSKRNLGKNIEQKLGSHFNFRKKNTHFTL